MAQPPVIMFLSAGRCGTQWLSAGLARLYRELDAEHEPLGPLYHPRRYFRAYASPDAILELPEVAHHVARIERSERPYVETGWPLFPVLPLLAQRIPDRLRIVHLTRHPVPSALSHLVHKSYAGSPRDDAYTRLATLAPTDPGVVQTHYAEMWDRLSPYEKCLFWWTEVHQFALELASRADWVPFLRVKSEDVLAGDADALGQMVAFMGRPWDERWLGLTALTIDRWYHRTDEPVDPLQVRRHPATVVLARRLGYDLGELDVAELQARYRGKPDPGLDRLGRYAGR